MSNSTIYGGHAFHPSSAPPLTTNAADEDDLVEDDDDASADASAVQAAIVSAITDATCTTLTSSCLSHSDTASASMTSQPATTTLIK